MIEGEIAKSVAKNTISQMVQQLITWSTSFALMLFLPRRLGPVDYGRLYLAMSISAIFLLAVDFDGRIAIAKRIARQPEESGQIIMNAISLRVILWILAFLGMISFAFAANYPNTVKILIMMFAVELSWLALRTVFSGLFLGHEVVKYATIGNIVERLFISVVGITALLLGVGVVGMAAIMISGTLLNALLCIKYAGRIIPKIPRVDWGATKLMAREGVAYLLWGIFGVVYYRIDSVMLSFLTPESVVGWYGASYKFFDVLSFLPGIFSLSILPVLSRMWGKEKHMLARTTQKSLDFILLAGIPISILIAFHSEFIIKLFFGLQGYAPSVVNLEIFSVGLLLVYIDMVLGTALFACDKQRQWAIVAFLAVIVNVSLNLALIPFTQTQAGNGGIGASVATILTEFFVMFSALVIMPKSVFEGGSVSVSLKAVFSGALMIALSFALTRTLIPWYLQAAFAAATYGGSLLLFKTFNSQEIGLMKSLLSFRNLRDTFALNKGASA
ncbi:MAG TPA: flippase [Bacteroidota bacterium]|nr:flippase [Bacteroidota bacterium]